MIVRQGLGELTAMVHMAAKIAADGDREYVRSQAQAEGIEQDMERRAVASGFTVDEVLFAAQNEQPEPQAA